MPTSSQALILYKTDRCQTPVPRPSQHTWLRNVAPCSLAGVYNLNGCMPMSCTGVKPNQAVRALGRESAQLFKYHSLPRGLTSILSFDQSTQKFRWQAIGGAENKPDGKHISFSNSLEDQASRYDTNIPRRPLSANTGIKMAKFSVNQFEYDQMVDLGFRSRSLVIDESVLFEQRVTRSESSPSSNTRYRRESTRARTSGNAAGTSQHRTTSCDNVRQQKGQRDQIESDDSEDKEEDEEEEGEEEGEDELNYVQHEQSRIKPSFYMRKDTPPPRPLAAVMSFRDNENTSHAEVKYLIETQLGVRVQAIQFDPLNVRVCKDNVRSRWIVDLSSKRDLDTVVRNGLEIGNDKIIVYKYDDITKREVSTFKYFMTIQEAKRKLKKTKSPWKTAKAVKNIVQLRTTKSNKL